ncbi:MAG: hypothetical protein IT434_16895 [Phycisphaerales bacterium]|jgi:hypothetical protein|nr:hypothetical protein [Phycisphaerales bacterium]
MTIFGRVAMLPLLALVLVLAACDAAISQGTYDQIQKGMTLGEVESILGGKGEEQANAGMSIGAGGTVGSTTATKTKTYVWRAAGRKEISVTFDEDMKVKDKNSAGI